MANEEGGAGLGAQLPGEWRQSSLARAPSRAGRPVSCQCSARLSKMPSIPRSPLSVSTANAPELRIYQHVPPQGSVTGWIVATMARPPLGGTPRLTLSVREAVGHQHLLVIPQTDPQVYSSQAGR